MLDEEEEVTGVADKVKWRTLVAILVASLIGNMMVTNLVAFLPTFVS